jgi:hypothetical protein
VLGRGHAAVAFATLAPPSIARLRAAFARTDGLSSVDADELAQRNNGFVVEGVNPAGADALVEVLAEVGIEARVVGDAVLRLPAPLPVVGLDLPASRRELRATFAVGDALVAPFSTIRAGTFGVVAAGRGRDSSPPPSSTAAPTLDLLVGTARAARRLRIEGAGFNVVDVAHRLARRGVPFGRPFGQGGHAPWTVWRAERDRDRELAWTAWNAAR